MGRRFLDLLEKILNGEQKMIPAIRHVDEADLNFIFNSFLRSLRGYPEFAQVSNEDYYSGQKLELEQYLRSHTTLVLCNPEDPGHIFGYIIALPDEATIFVYVKYTYRKFGFAKLLLEAAHPSLYNKTIKAAYTCRNWAAVSTKFRHLFNPYIRSKS